MSVFADDSPVLSASSYIDPTQGLVASAVLLSEAVVAALGNTARVTVDLAGLRSLSSSFFNTLLLGVASRFGTEAIRNRLLFRFSSVAQQEIFKRSYTAVLRNLGT
jgi:hypothetical protein